MFINILVSFAFILLFFYIFFIKQFVAVVVIESNIFDALIGQKCK